MKKILIKTLALGLSAFTLGACVDMSEDVYSSIVSENFKPTDKDIMSVMGPSYTAMQNRYLDGLAILTVKRSVQTRL